MIYTKILYKIYIKDTRNVQQEENIYKQHIYINMPEKDIQVIFTQNVKLGVKLTKIEMELQGGIFKTKTKKTIRKREI